MMLTLPTHKRMTVGLWPTRRTKMASGCVTARTAVSQTGRLFLSPFDIFFCHICSANHRWAILSSAHHFPNITCLSKTAACPVDGLNFYSPHGAKFNTCVNNDHTTSIPNDRDKYRDVYLLILAGLRCAGYEWVDWKSLHVKTPWPKRVIM